MVAFTLKIVALSSHSECECEVNYGAAETETEDDDGDLMSEFSHELRTILH